MKRPAALLFAVVLLAPVSLSCGSSTPSTPAPAAAPDGGADAQAPAKPTPTCTAPATPCGDVCVNRDTDLRNCGACGNACKTGQVCAQGRCGQPAAFTITKLFWGDTDRAGVPSPTAWKGFGEDIDGLSSTSASTDVCKLVLGAPKSVHNDGAGGADNAYGASIVPIIAAAAGSDWSKKYNDTLAAGTGLFLLDLRGYAGETDLQQLSLRVLLEGDLPAKPKLDGTDRWPVLSSSFDGMGKAVLSFDAAKIVSGVLDSGPRSGTLTLRGAFGDIPVERLHITGKVSGTTIQNGTVSGVVPFKKFEALFRENAGRMSTSLCSGAALENIIAQLKQASDILSDGTQDPAKECDGISIGLGFEAVGVAVGETVKPPDPLPNPCK